MRELGSRDWDVTIVGVVRMGLGSVESVTADIAKRVAPFTVSYEWETARLTFTGELIGLTYPRAQRVLEEIYYRAGMSPERVVKMSLTAREEQEEKRS
jgi:hypothetical protein